MTQPSLSSAIKDLEEEMGITILDRSNAGVSLTADGREFMAYARQILDQVNLLDDRYKNSAPQHQSFAVSAQHYAFVVNAFVELLKEVNSPSYKFTLRETETENIFNDLAPLNELGILYTNGFNRCIIKKLLSENGLTFTLSFTQPHVFLSCHNLWLTASRSPWLSWLICPTSLSKAMTIPFIFLKKSSRPSYKKEIKVSTATIFNSWLALTATPSVLGSSPAS